MRLTRTSMFAILVLFGLSTLFLLFGNLQTSSAVHKALKESIDTPTYNNQVLKENNGKQENIDDKKLSEIETLLRQLHQRLDDNSQKFDQINQIGDNKDEDLKNENLQQLDKVPKLLPLDFTKVLNKTVGNLDTLLETPANIPAQPIGVQMDKMSYMMDRNYKPSQCPKTIGSITRYSSWFKDRYRSGLKMWLDETDIYDWDTFHKIRHYGMPFGLATVDRTILGKIMNNPNFTNAPLTDTSKQCVRCAVIGSGGILNGSHAGEEIDSHDYVFRVNRALTSEKYARDVGKKTSFYEFFPESQHVWSVSDPNAAFLYTSFKKTDLYYAEAMLRGAVSSRMFNVEGVEKSFFIPPVIDPSRVKLTHPDFFRYIFTHFLDLKGYRPTTGALVVFTAIYLCDEVTIYGFGYDPRFTMHYYDTKFIKHTDESTGSHDVKNERELWYKLHTEGVIKLFKRDF